MRGRLLLALSLGLNLVLAVFLIQTVYQSDRSSPPSAAALMSEGKGSSKTNVIIRRNYFHWSDLESTNYPVFIENLRRIGCPEETIRDIVVGEVNQLFEQRIARELVIPEQKWWLSEPDMDAFEAVANQLMLLETEKERLLTTLLGPGWKQQEDLPKGADAALRFDGPVLGAMSPEKRAAVLAIENQAGERIRTLLEAGADGDPAELARLRSETRAALAQVLTPAEMEEYLLRYSSTAVQLREQLSGFDASPDEFRGIFRARDALDLEIARLGGANDPATVKRREDLEAIREQAVQAALGPERYPLYRLTQDPLFREAQQQVEQNGGTPENVLPIYRIHQASEQALSRIQRDPGLSEQEKAEAMELIRREQRASIDRLMNAGAGVE